MSTKGSALSVQQGGNHYKTMAIQPVEFITANNLGFIEGCVIKYVCRHANKDGARDLRKAKHFLDLLLELNYPDAAAPSDELACKQQTARAGDLADTQADDTGNIPSIMLAGNHYENASDAPLLAVRDACEMEAAITDVIAKALGVDARDVRMVKL